MLSTKARTMLRRGTRGTVVDHGGTNGVYENKFVRIAAVSIVCIAGFWLCCAGVLYYFVTTEKIIRISERVHVSL